MNKGLIRFLILFLLPLKLFAATPLDQIVVFGDSLSDNGRIYSIFNNAHKVIPSIPIFPKSPPYYQGRFSNGPVWAEDLGADLNLRLYDYSMGGAWMESFWQTGIPFPWSLDVLLSNYLTENLFDQNKAKHLFVIWAGGNDYLNNRLSVDWATSQAINALRVYIEKLVLFGAKHIVIMNLPDLGTIPYSLTKGSDYSTRLTQLTQMHNLKLSVMLSQEIRFHKNVNFILFDSYSFQQKILSNPEQFHFKNVKDACYTGSITLKDSAELKAINEKLNIDVANNPELHAAFAASQATDPQICDAPDSYIFWDSIHPSEAMHQLIAQQMVQVLKDNKWI